MVQHATTLGADRKCRPRRVRDELLSVAGRLARDGETPIPQTIKIALQVLLKIAKRLLIHTRSARVGFNKTVSLHHLLLRYVKWFCLHPHLLLVNPVECEQDRLTSPLRSITITVTSSLIRATPSQCLASVLRFLWVLHLNGSLCIKTTGSRSSIEKPESDSRHLHAGHRLGGIQDNPQTYPGDTTHFRFRCHVLVHDETAVVSLTFVFLIHTCRVLLDVSSTLTTAALNDSRLRWFEACS